MLFIWDRPTGPRQGSPGSATGNTTFINNFQPWQRGVNSSQGILEGFMYLWNCLPVTALGQGYTGVTMEITGPNWQGLEFPKLRWGRNRGGLHLYLPQFLTEIQHFLPWRAQRTNLISIHRTCDFVTNGNYRYSHITLQLWQTSSDIDFVHDYLKIIKSNAGSCSLTC